MSKRSLWPFTVATALAALLLMVPCASAQPPSPYLELYPPSLHLTVGEASAPLVVRDRSGNVVQGALAFSNFDATLISVSSDGRVTALRSEGPTEIGTWLRASFNGVPISNATVVRVVSRSAPNTFQLVDRSNTSLYYPASIDGEDIALLVNRYQIPDVNEYAYAIQQNLMQVAMFNGARQVFAIDFGESETSRVCGISGNPIRLGWNLLGSPWQNCFLVPFIAPRSPQWFIMHHELGHNFTWASQAFARGLGGLSVYSEGIASALAMADMDVLQAQHAPYPISADTGASLAQQSLQYTQAFTASYQAWIAQGAPFAGLDANIVDAIWLRHRSQRPADFGSRFFLPLQPEFYTRVAPVLDRMGSNDQHTIYAALIGAAVGQDLSQTFAGTYNFPVNSALYSFAYSTFLGIMEAPPPPTSLTGSTQGSSVSLAWVAPAGASPASYVIEAGSTPGQANLAVFATGNASTAFAAGGVPNGLYYVRVRAANAYGAGRASNEVSVRVGAAPPNAPTGLTASVSGNDVTLTWTAPADGSPPTGYSIEAGTGPTLANIVNFGTGSVATTFAAGGVPAGAYYVRVRATNPQGTSSPSNEAVLFVGCPGAPGTPANLRVVANSGGAVTIAWDAATGAPASYLLQAGSSPGATNLGTFPIAAPTTAFSAGGVPPGTYFLRVVARNPCGTSSTSNEIVLVVG